MGDLGRVRSGRGGYLIWVTNEMITSYVWVQLTLDTFSVEALGMKSLSYSNYLMV